MASGYRAGFDWFLITRDRVLMEKVCHEEGRKAAGLQLALRPPCPEFQMFRFRYMGYKYYTIGGSGPLIFYCGEKL